jgi:hypothetical protein
MVIEHEWEVLQEPRKYVPFADTDSKVAICKNCHALKWISRFAMIYAVDPNQKWSTDIPQCRPNIRVLASRYLEAKTDG